MKNHLHSHSKYAVCLFVFVVTLSIICCTWEIGFTKSDPVEAKVAKVFDKADPQIQAAIAVQNRHTPGLIALPEVAGTGVGLTKDGKPAIVVYTLCPVNTIPHMIENLPVIVKVTGMFVALDGCDTTARLPRPIPIGVSTGHPDITAGTIGCRVKDESGNVYALSNNHVYANCNDASNGDNVLQPGPYDGGTDPTDVMGVLYDFEPILFNGSDNTIDAAIASSSTYELECSTCSSNGYGIPNSDIQPATVNLGVQKCGRTTGCTQGVVTEINVTVDVCYETAGPFRCRKLARFVDQIAITPGNFSAGGDSGSLIVANDENKKPVGLLFAGSDTRTLANPIDLVLTRFGVTVDDCSGNIPPNADFTYTSSELTTNFTDTSVDSDGTIINWDWDFGDGGISTAQNPIHTYAASGTYNVTLTVTDDGGATDSVSNDVTVTTGNAPPIADFTYTTNELTVSFTDTSTDSDGTIINWDWDFGDDGTSTAQNPIHTYAASGTYNVTLTVTDDGGATDSVSNDVTVTVSSEILLTATGYTRGATKKVDLEWSGATSVFVDIYRNNILIAITENDGFYNENLGKNVNGDFTYQVCDQNTANCSNVVTVTF